MVLKSLETVEFIERRRPQIVNAHQRAHRVELVRGLSTRQLVHHAVLEAHLDALVKTCFHRFPGHRCLESRTTRVLERAP